MKHDDLKNMRQITDALYQMHRHSLREIAIEESRLRKLISGLDQHDQESLRALSKDLVLRSLGQDMNWKRWSEKKRRGINLKLAMTLSKKESALAKLQRSFGRSSALDELAKTSEHGRRNAQTQREVEINQQLVVLRKMKALG